MGKILLAAVLALVPTISNAEALNLTVGEARTLLIGLYNLDCPDRIAGPGGRPVCKEGTRYKFSGAVMMKIASDIDALIPISTRYEEARGRLMADLPTSATVGAGDERAPNLATAEGRDAAKKFDEMLSSKQQVQLIKLSEADLQIDEGAKNPIPAATLAGIYVLIERKP